MAPSSISGLHYELHSQVVALQYTFHGARAHRVYPKQAGSICPFNSHSSFFFSVSISVITLLSVSLLVWDFFGVAYIKHTRELSSLTYRLVSFGQSRSTLASLYDLYTYLYLRAYVKLEAHRHQSNWEHSPSLMLWSQNAQHGKRYNINNMFPYN